MNFIPHTKINSNSKIINVRKSKENKKEGEGDIKKKKLGNK